MSAYVVGQTAIQDIECLLSALVEIGFSKNSIEVHETPKHLYGYHGDLRDDVAHVIIRRWNVGHVSNDLGFIRGEDGRFQVIVSEYDSSANEEGEWVGHLDRRFKCTGGFTKDIATRAAIFQAEKAAQRRGMKTERVTKGRKVTLRCFS